MTYALDISFFRGDPKRFGSKDGGIRLSGDNPDDVLDRLVHHIDEAFKMIEDDPSACSICALVDPANAKGHDASDHEEED